jgi:hypothetical protein
MRMKLKILLFHVVVFIWQLVVEIKVFGFGNVSIYFSYQSIENDFLSNLDNEEENDFACAAVLTTHTQDVKHLKWHPQKDVTVYFLFYL